MRGRPQHKSKLVDYSRAAHIDSQPVIIIEGEDKTAHIWLPHSAFYMAAIV
jgi:hypothetical protein